MDSDDAKPSTFYIHDITTTSLSNSHMLDYCKQNGIDLRVIPVDIRSYISGEYGKSIDVIVMQCYEWDGVRVRQDNKHLVTVVGECYSHYVEDENGSHVMSKAGLDSYNFETRQYQKKRYRKECFFSEQESSKRVVELFRKGHNVCGNSHKFINEFCYNLYRDYLHKQDFKGRLMRKPTTGHPFPLLMKRPFFESETVLFGKAADIQVVDDTHVNDFFYEHKTLSFDIETVMIDATGKKIRDRIIQLSLAYQEGRTLRRRIGITIGEANLDPSEYEFAKLNEYFQATLPDTEIYCVKTERQLVERFVEVVCDVRPDYIAGYNVIQFDLPMLLKSADGYGIDLLEQLSHMKGFSRDRILVRNSLRALMKKRNSTLDEEGVSTIFEDNSLFDLNYTLFPGMLVNDLYRCHKDERLDDLATSALGFGKEDVSYADIPTLFYSPHVGDRSRLLKYNILDSLLCSALINVSDDFSSYKFFVTSSYMSKIPHSEFFNNQKTPLIAPMFYYAFRRLDILQDMKIKPLRESNRLSVGQLLRHFVFGRPCTYLPAKELVEKFRSGEIKTKTVRKQFCMNGHLDKVDVVAAVDILKMQHACAQKKNTKHGSQFYTLTHLLLYVRYLTETVEQSYDVEGLIDDFCKVKRFGRYAPVIVCKRKTNAQSSVEEDKKLTTLLVEFARYMVERTISSTHIMEQLVDDFCENEMIDRKFENQVKCLGAYLNDGEMGGLRDQFWNFRKIMSQSKVRCRFNDLHAEDTLIEAVWNIIEGNLLMKFDTPNKYDGAWVCLPNPGVELERPVCCVDFSSLYPTLGISYNVGPETIISRKTIVENDLRVGEDYELVNLHARDDHRKIDIRELSDCEARENYVCFVKPKHLKSVYCTIWNDILENRLKYKRLIGTFTNSTDNKRVKEMSDTFKITANSVYGVLTHMGLWKISAAITSRGRQNIQNVAKDIEETHGSVTVYGDTDSVMFHLNLTTDQLCQSYANGDMIEKEWISGRDTDRIDSCNGDDYKKGCEIAAAVSRCITEKMNSRYLTGSDRTIYTPPCQLDHEKVMLPFVIFAQKHYFARIMDTSDETPPYILRGLECRKRTKLQATVDVENAMFADLLQCNPCTWNTYNLARDIVNRLKAESMDLNKICSRKKIAVFAKSGKRNDAGTDLSVRMKGRSELVDTGGLDKISVTVIKVASEGKTVKYESLAYLSKRQRDGLSLNLDAKAIVRQILLETVKIMRVVHPPSTYQHFSNLLDLNVADSAREDEFRMFVTPDEAKREKASNTKTKRKKKRVLNSTMYNFFPPAKRPKT